MLRQYAVLLAMLILVGCNVSTVPTTVFSPTLAPTPKAVATIQLPTITPRPSATNTPSPTATFIPVTKPTVTRVSSHTLGSTLTNVEEQSLVLNLLKNNEDCRLPCWWGFTPGETAWPVAERFFPAHGKRVERYHDSQGAVYSVDFSIPQHGSRINQDYYVADDEVIDVITVHAVPPVRDEKLAFGDAQLAEDWNLYMLPQMLTTYGQPSEVFLETFTGTPDGGRPPFSLLLYYPEKGILVRYYGPVEIGVKTLRVCPSHADVSLWLWSSEDSMTLDHLASLGNEPVGEMSWFRSLEEATGMSVEQFYRSFIQSNNRTCLETPADLW